MIRIITILFLFLSTWAGAQHGMLLAKPAAGGGAFSPADIDSLFYWFDASTGVLDDGGAAASDGDNVGTWQDQSGNGHNVTQATAGSYPIYRATLGPGSLPAIEFDGSADWLGSAAHWWESDDLTIVCVFAVDDTTPAVSGFIVNRMGTTSNRQFDFFAGDSGSGFVYNSRVYNTGASANYIRQRGTSNSATFTIEIIVHDGAGNATWRSNGSDVSVSTATFGSGDGTIYDLSEKLSIGAIFPSSTPTAFLDGKIAEIIVYSKQLTGTEITNIESYLNTKYSIY